MRRRRRAYRWGSSEGARRPSMVRCSSDCVMGPSAKHRSVSSLPRQIVSLWIRVSLANRADQSADLNPHCRDNSVMQLHCSREASRASAGMKQQLKFSAASNGSCGRKSTGPAPGLSKQRLSFVNEGSRSSSSPMRSSPTTGPMSCHRAVTGACRKRARPPGLIRPTSKRCRWSRDERICSTWVSLNKGGSSASVWSERSDSDRHAARRLKSTKLSLSKEERRRRRLSSDGSAANVVSTPLSAASG